MIKILAGDTHIVSYIYNIPYTPYLRHSRSLTLCYLKSSTCLLDLIFLSKQVLFILQSSCFFWDSFLILPFNSFSFVRHNSHGMLHRPSKRECQKPTNILRLSILSGWTVTVISFGTGLISLLHECLPPLN